MPARRKSVPAVRAARRRAFSPRSAAVQAGLARVAGQRSAARKATEVPPLAVTTQWVLS
ncbi:MAG: hypothetical protein RL456_372 [Pseudomonadota bacterium]|jgi:hypothetical protein